MTPITTERLLLRAWCDSDRAPFAAMNADPVVMRWFPSVLSAAQSNALVDRFIAAAAAGDLAFMAAEENATRRFVGAVGLSRVRSTLPVAPATEIGWRLSADVWGRGYATEAATGLLADAFRGMELDEILSFTAALNSPSRRVMEKAGLRRLVDRDFDHPGLPPGHSLRPHVVYGVTRDEWRR